MKLPITLTLEVSVYHESLNGLKILHLSDLHIDKRFKLSSIKELLSICKNLDYDFIVITGDIIDCKVKHIKNKLELFNDLALEKAVYYISGNHDIFYGLKDLKKELSNFILLDNKMNTINFKGKEINIVGISDRFAKFFNIKRDEKKVSSFLNSNKPTIFLAHQPKDYKLAVLNKTELFVCGHTHGGQIFPFHLLVRLVQPFLNGLFYKEQTAIYVSRGLGTWGIDFRYKANSEITILKLISKTVK
ncbi:metallophosphoesterase [Poseidonibacter ostreae]|jgi:uncharacterized protein|uniref:Metallophosphoesterase n=1 Tax=Poseidonibacter ostreae TaxID=2654171 RepID=A0ABQ6VQ65_9BACT|nr:metallophosphoesterase [Poseidonibacter ostreae]KAB7883045.1 metallophosphoesterase [Poseidonibacter ostreae]KAB7892913.1 metallophosphoesterase [Poseidonibacter ostreae]